MESIVKTGPRPTLNRILQDTERIWDTELFRPEVRSEFRKVIQCGNRALGAEVYGSDNGQRKIVPYTCKSRICPRCGRRATLVWQQMVIETFPRIPFIGVGLTMPDTFWAIFKKNREHLPDLPTLGAGVVQDLVLEKYAADVGILLVCHTFGAYLNFNTHLHMMVTRLGLSLDRKRLVEKIRFSAEEILPRWRHALIDHLRRVLDMKGLNSDRSPDELRALFDKEDNRCDREWIGRVDGQVEKDVFFRYISRYLLRAPIAKHRLLAYDGRYVTFKVYDRKLKRRVEYPCPVEEFLPRLADQVPDRYRHGVRYFGLFAPRSSATYADFLSLLGQVRRPRPKRPRWAELYERSFGRNPLLDSDGRPMYRIRSIPPAGPGRK